MHTVRRLTVALVVVIYFGLLLIPEWWPAFRATAAYLVYVLTLPSPFWR